MKAGSMISDLTEGAQASTSAEEPLLVIEPTRGVFSIDWQELWHYRELFYFLVWRDVLVRYKQTVLGVAWAVLQPLATMVVLTLFFGRLAKIPSDGIPYPLFSYAALLLWTFFSGSLNFAARSLVSNYNVVTKLYFPRMILPTAPVIAGLLDLAIASLLMFVLMAFYGLYPTVRVVAIPLMVLVAFISTLGVGLFLAAMNVKYRDFRFVVPFLTQFWMFVSPVAYPVSLIPEKWRLLYYLNPMAGAIEGFRWALFHTPMNPWPGLGISAVAGCVILAVGLAYFQKTHRFFADII